MAAGLPLYDLALLGSPTPAQVADVRRLIEEWTSTIGMSLGSDVGWNVGPAPFLPHQRSVSAAAVFGTNVSDSQLRSLIEGAVPTVPVVSRVERVAAEVPLLLQRFSAVSYERDGPERVATALLECAGLLPRERQVFLSYRRSEATPAAVQLFEAFAAKGFHVFLDTHEIAPGVDFQEALWHQLCDSDVLVMLDSPTYFESRWTAAEFGRALAKGIAVLRVGWPDSTPSVRTGTASRAELLESEIDSVTGRLQEAAVARIVHQLEAVRSLSHATRWRNLATGIQLSAEKVGGMFQGLGAGRTVRLSLPSSVDVVVLPALGVPTSRSLEAVSIAAGADKAAVVYDHIGMSPAWLSHLDWLGQHVGGVRWIREHEVSWKLAGWEADEK